VEGSLHLGPALPLAPAPLGQGPRALLTNPQMIHSPWFIPSLACTLTTSHCLQTLPVQDFNLGASCLIHFRGIEGMEAPHQ
jgi:hypothetical protein